MLKYFFMSLFLFINLDAQILTPLERSNFKKVTGNSELVEFVNHIESNSKVITVDTLTLSPLKKVIPLIKVSSSNFDTSNEKIRVLIVAQQHGNEHSGKEASLLFLKNIIGEEINYLLSKIDILLIPQINPDGSDKNERRNGNGADLNRNHSILTEPEVEALHKIFNQYLPEVTLDIHEYTPYSKEWMEFGYRKNFDVQAGILTNPNIYKPLIDLQRGKFLEYMRIFLYYAGFTFNEYIVGGPPNKSRLRYSTVDINDGRQSFGIQNTFSVIFEGINGRDPLDNIEHRVEGQYKAILGLLSFVYDNFSSIKKIVKEGRENLLNNQSGNVSIQMEHTGNLRKEVNLLSVKSGKDTSIVISNFHDKVETKLHVKKPVGYLIPKSDTELIELLQRHNVKTENYKENSGTNIYQYYIKEFTNISLEELDLKTPVIEKKFLKSINSDSYLYVPINQLKANTLVLILEPESMMNILQYEKFAYLLKVNSFYPVLRIEENKTGN